MHFVERRLTRTPATRSGGIGLGLVDSPFDYLGAWRTRMVHEERTPRWRLSVRPSLTTCGYPRGVEKSIYTVDIDGFAAKQRNSRLVYPSHYLCRNAS
jgi:hypothetical protein